MPGVLALVFDFDGVIADSEPLHLRTYQEVLAAEGLSLDRDEYYDRYLGFDDAAAFRAIGAAHGRRWSDQQIAALVVRKTAVFDALLGSAAMLYPGAASCITRLAGRFPLGIASGALKHEILAVLRSAGLERYFQFIVAAGDTPRSKPAPDPYRRAAELHRQAPASCLAIEDSRWGIESATAAGLRSVGITNSYPAHELAQADAVIDSLDELTGDLIDSLGTARG